MLPAGALAAASYPDVPGDSWAADVIAQAGELGLMRGNADGSFGYGKAVSRAEFVTVLCRMFGWETQNTGASPFTDMGGWYDGYIEAALAHDTLDAGGAFRPNDAITRREMAVMLVRALGLSALAGEVETEHLPFKDVTADRGYITIAYDIGMTTGVTATTFCPEAGAVREQAAAMLVRVYEKYSSNTDWTHGFYAFSSYSQKTLASELYAVSFGWSRMEWNGASASLSTGSDNGNEWRIPSGYADITGYLEASGVSMNLCVHMSDGAGEMLASAGGAAQAAAAIAARVAGGDIEYSGVTIDFEGLFASSKRAFTGFLTSLRAALPDDAALYCCVQPLTADGACYDGYDYRAIGEVCDKVIIMAHDYSPVSLDGMEGTSWQYNTAPAPLASVWYSLLRITDAKTGVEDKDKLALALDLSCEGWYVDGNDKVVSGEKLTPSMETVHSRMGQSDTRFGRLAGSGWSWINYSTQDGRRVFMWYPSTESVSQELLCARLLGITGVSVWRLGNIPDYADWNVWDAITA